MRAEKLNDGRVKYVEEFKNPITNKRQRVSVTYEKHSKKNEKLAQKELILKIEKKTKQTLTHKKNIYQDLTLGELSKEFLKDKVELKNSTLDTYKRGVNNLFSAIDKDIRLSKINNTLLINNLIDDCQTKTNIKYLKILLTWGKENDFIENFPNKPFNRVSKKINKTDKINSINKKLYLEKEEVNKILEDIKSHKSYYGEMIYCLVVLLINTGLRIGEAMALNYDDIDDDNILTVDKTLFNKNIQTPKSISSYRKLAVNDAVVECINKTKEIKKKHGLDNTNIIFTNMKGRHTSYSQLHKILKEYTGNYGFHIFRHTHASFLAEMGVSLDQIQRRLGHENDMITKKIYVHITEKIKEKDNELFRSLELL